MGKKNNKSTTTVNQTTTNGPLAQQQGMFQTLWDNALSAYNKTDKSGTLNQFEQQAQDVATQAAANTGIGLNETRNLALKQLNGDFLNPSSNPYLTGAVDAANAQIKNQLLREILPSTNSAAIASGAYGGSRNGIKNSQAITDYNTAALNNANDIFYKNYANERAIQQNSPALLEAANKQETAGSQILSALGAGVRELQQTAQWAGLDKLAQILTAGGFSTSTTNGTTTTNTPTSGLGAALSGASGGASIGGSVRGPWGAALGGILGGLGGIFG